MSNRNGSQDRKGQVKRSIEERLKDHPDLIARLEALADIVENSDGDVEKADEAERRVLEEVRQMGHQVLQGWAQRQQRKKAEAALSQERELKRKEKKT
jgi:uncharacterized Ntn-hydrolase superfamily protein